MRVEGGLTESVLATVVSRPEVLKAVSNARTPLPCKIVLMKLQYSNRKTGVKRRMCEREIGHGGTYTFRDPDLSMLSVLKAGTRGACGGL